MEEDVDKEEAGVSIRYNSIANIVVKSWLEEPDLSLKFQQVRIEISEFSAEGAPGFVVKVEAAHVCRGDSVDDRRRPV